MCKTYGIEAGAALVCDRVAVEFPSVQGTVNYSCVTAARAQYELRDAVSRE